MERLQLPLVDVGFGHPDYYTNIRKCLIGGFFSHIAHLEKSGIYTTILDHQVVALHPSTCLTHKPEWVLYNELVLTAKNYIRICTQVRPEWMIDMNPEYFDDTNLPRSEAQRALSQIKRSRMR